MSSNGGEETFTEEMARKETVTQLFPPAPLVHAPTLFQLALACVLHHQSLVPGKRLIFLHLSGEAERPVLYLAGLAQPQVRATKLDQLPSHGPVQGRCSQPIRPLLFNCLGPILNNIRIVIKKEHNSTRWDMNIRSN